MAPATNMAAPCLLVLVLLFFLAGGGHASPATDELRRVSSCAVAAGTDGPASPTGDEHGGTSPDLGARAASWGGAQTSRSPASSAVARVWEGGGGRAERRVGRDASLPSNEDETDEEEIDEG